MKQLRLETGDNMSKTARKLGIPYTTYVNYEKGEREPNSEMLIQIATYFGVSIDYLLGRSDIRNGDSYINSFSNISDIAGIVSLPETIKVPLIGTIACGEPILAEENVEAYINMPKNLGCDFALRCKGDSMINARIFDGDIVYIKEQPDVESGEIAAVLIGDEATLKRVYKYPTKLVLRPENPMYEDFVFVGEELNNIRIIGKAVAFTSMIR